ncbi:MAG: hypothetical protein FWD25_08680 [Clostridia bacterium]|nr:hypothetical protein [Clostridia bacterium]
MKNPIAQRKAYGVLALFVLCVLLFCTKASPLFVFHDNYDVNVYLTMGKGMLRGMVPYRDLVEGKGPLFYLMFGLASLVDPRGFMGVFILIFAAQWGACVLAFKIANHYLHSPTRSFCVAACLPLFITRKFFLCTIHGLWRGHAR